MIVDYTQKGDKIEISYVADNGAVALEEIFIEPYKYVECDEYDPEKIDGIKSLYGKGIKKEIAKRFEGHNINNFFVQDLKQFPDLFAKADKIAFPKTYSFDIETDIDPDKGYGDPRNPFNPVRSISITNEQLNSVLFIVRNPSHPEFTDVDMEVMKNKIITQLGPSYANKYEFKINVKVFDTEKELLSNFISNIRNYFHVIMGWNIYGFDIPYITSRCEKNGIDFFAASPTKGKNSITVSSKKDKNGEKQIEKIVVPNHRLFVDYMLLFKESLVYNNLGSYSLDNCSSLVLGLNKISYSGNLRTLYENDYLSFCSYAFIDTILVQLLNIETNLLTTDFFQSYYTKVPFAKLSQNSISEALIYHDLASSNQFLLESEFNTHNVPRKYQGGFVKAPTRKIVNSVMGLDFSSLYPNSINTCKISPETKVDRLQVDVNGFPSTIEDQLKWDKYKEAGCVLCPTGTVYSNNPNAIYPRIEKKLIAERKIFRKCSDDIFVNIFTQIENEAKARGINL